MITALFAELSKYRVVTRLGSGGMAEVYLVLSERPGGFNKLQVLKLMRSDLTEQERPEFLQMFEDEARLAARLNHPNIVQSFEVGNEEGQPYIVMEFLEGQSLHRVQERARHLGGGFPLEMELFVLCQTLEGLEYAHRLSDYAGNPLHIVHRDVSPQNVFITYTGQTKLVDFGVAKTLESSKTRAGVVKGKVAYMPPEQVASGPIDHRADLFSVGVLLWEAIAGRPMYADLTVFESMSRLVRGDLPKIREVAPNVRPELEAIVERALQLDPAQRYQDAESFRSELHAYLDGTSRVRARDVGTAVEKLFQRERSELSQIIRRAMTTSKPPEKEEGEASVKRITRRLPLEEDAAGAPDTPRAVAATPAPVAFTDAPKDKRRDLGRGAIIGALSLVLAAGVATYFSTREPRAEGPQQAAAALPPVAAAPVEARMQEREIALAIDVEPKFATIELDGKELGKSPVLAQEPRDAREHTLTMSAPGYAPLSKIVSFDADVKLSVQLEKLAPPSQQPVLQPTAAKAEPRAPARGPQRASPSSASKPSSEQPADPYVDLPAPKRVKRSAPELDKTDPWASGAGR